MLLIINYAAFNTNLIKLTRMVIKISIVLGSKNAGKGTGDSPFFM